MAQFCSQCGNPLSQCTCNRAQVQAPSPNVSSSLKSRMGIYEPTGSQSDVYERDKRIVPESIACDEGEIPVRQYNAAILRTRWQFKRAEGRLQITNKRVIFRANGKSLMGRTLFQQEFSISEIGGLELRKDWRFGIFDFLFVFLISKLVNTLFSQISSAIGRENEALGVIFTLLFGLLLLAPSLLLKKKFFIKILTCAASLGLFVGGTFGSIVNMLEGYSSNDGSAFMILFALIALVFECISLFLFSFKENLSIVVRGKGGAGDAVVVQADVGSGLLARMFGRGNSGVNCGFSEVLPTKATDTAICEVGAIINDIQSMGDYAVEKWRE